MGKTILVFADGTGNEGGLLPDECLRALSGNADWARINHRPEEAAGALRPRHWHADAPTQQWQLRANRISN